MITEKDYLKGRDKDQPLTDIQKQNMADLLKVINQVRDAWGKEFFVTSGYRPDKLNAIIGGAPNSAHCTCQAIDLEDHGDLKQWVIDNGILEKYDLYMEDPKSTDTWCHLQRRKTKSGKRIFIP